MTEIIKIVTSPENFRNKESIWEVLKEKYHVTW